MPKTANLSDDESVTPPNSNNDTNSNDKAPATPLVTLSLADRKRAAGLDAMSDRAFTRCQDVLSSLKLHRGSEAEFRYRVGTVYADLLDNHAVYGRSDARLFARVMERHRTTLDDWARVARTWTPEQFKDLMEQRFQRTDMPLSFSHLIEISGVTDRGERDRWIDLTFQGGWSAKRLSREVKKGAAQLVEDPEPPADPDAEDDEPMDGTDHVVTPTTIRQAIVRMRGEIQMLPDMLPEWRERVFVPLGDDPGQFGQTALTELEQTRGSCDEAIRTFEGIMRQIDEVLLQARQTEKPSENTEVEEGGDGNGH